MALAIESRQLCTRLFPPSCPARLQHCRHILFHWITGEALIPPTPPLLKILLWYSCFTIFCDFLLYSKILIAENHRIHTSVQSLSRFRLFVTPWIAAHQASLSITNSRSLLKLMSIESVMPSSHLILCRPLLLLPQSLPASGSFPMSQLFAWGGQSTGVLASVSVPSMNPQDWSPLGWTGWISLQSKGLSRVFSNTTVQKHQFFGTQLSSQSNSHIHTWLYIYCLWISFPPRSSQTTEYSSLCYTVGSQWLSTFYIVVYICPAIGPGLCPVVKCWLTTISQSRCKHSESMTFLKTVKMANGMFLQPPWGLALKT